MSNEAKEIENTVPEENITPPKDASTKDSTAKKDTVPKFTVERLRRDCLNLFGITQSTFDAATRDLKSNLSVDEMKEHIKKWQEKPAISDAAKKEAK